MRMIDLFSGIGGFSLAAEIVWKKELEIVYMVEKDKHCQKVLNKHWGDTPIHSDICDFKCDNINSVDLIAGGFPCQDISIAGKGKGIHGKRSSLWFEFKRIICECRPKFALIENVSRLTHRGLDTILCDLAEIGYDAEWQSISANKLGAWHKRERVWIVAYPTGGGCGTGGDTTEHKHILSEIGKTEENEQQWYRWERRFGKICKTFTNPTSVGLHDREVFETDVEQKQKLVHGNVSKRKGIKEIQEVREDKFRYWLSEPPVRRVDDGISDRVDRLKSLGNSIVPQNAVMVMEQIKKIMEKQS